MFQLYSKLLFTGDQTGTVEIFNFQELCWRYGASIATTTITPSFVYLNNRFLVQIGEAENTFNTYDLQSDEWMKGTAVIDGVTSTRSAYMLVSKEVFGCSFS